MALIHVPRPENAWNPNRPVNALLKAQILHLHEAERRLPLRHHTDIYINAIKTEGEAAEAGLASPDRGTAAAGGIEQVRRIEGPAVAAEIGRAHV